MLYLLTKFVKKEEKMKIMHNVIVWSEGDKSIVQCRLYTIKHCNFYKNLPTSIVIPQTLL